MRGSWAGNMQSALLAALAKPAWWALALAAFLVRGGFLIAILPIVSLPTTADLTNAFAPTIEALIYGRPSLEAVVAGTLLISGAFLALYGLLFAGSWLDLALLRETTSDPELELGWAPANRSATLALAIRLVAHLPTVVAIGYAVIRLIGVLYLELTSPGDTATPLALRILAQAPDAPLAVGITWLLGEAVGGLAVRRIAAGEPVAAAFGRSIRQVASVRGLATLGCHHGGARRPARAVPAHGHDRMGDRASRPVRRRRWPAGSHRPRVDGFDLGPRPRAPRRAALLAGDGMDRAGRASIGDRHAADAPRVGTDTLGLNRPLLHSRRSRGRT